MKVIEIFKSIDGEGIRAGFPVTFVRLGGCNLHCSYCDTRYAWEDNYEYKEMTAFQVYETVFKMGCKKVTLTGGEPLIHEDVDILIGYLTQSGFEVNIETNGSLDITPYIDNDNILLTVDYKCPSSGMEHDMYLTNLVKLRRTDVLKFVVGSEKDLDACKNMIEYTKAQVFISPVFGMIEPKQIVEYMLVHNMNNCRLQLQLHKLVWDPNERGV